MPKNVRPGLNLNSRQNSTYLFCGEWLVFIITGKSLSYMKYQTSNCVSQYTELRRFVWERRKKLKYLFSFVKTEGFSTFLSVACVAGVPTKVGRRGRGEKRVGVRVFPLPPTFVGTLAMLVSYAAVFSSVTQRLRDGTKNGCVGDYCNAGCQ